MKQVFILIIVSLYSMIGNCQVGKDIIDDKILEVVARQLFGNLKIKKSLGVPVSYNEQVDIHNYFDSKTLHNGCYLEYSRHFSALDFAEIEFGKILKNSFLLPYSEGSDIFFRAKHKNKMMYELVCKDDVQLITLSYPKKQIEEKIQYENGQLKSFNLQEELRRISYNYNRSEEGKYVKTIYDSKDKTYYVIEGCMLNDRSAKVIHYKKNENRNRKKIDKILMFDFYPDGKLKLKKGCNKNGSVRDSVKYLYQDEKIIKILKYNTLSLSSLSCDYYENGLIEKKVINDNESQVEISYLYNENDKIKELHIYIQGQSNRHKFYIDYITDEQLESIKYNKVDIDTKQVFEGNQFLFSYNENNMLKSLRIINQSGKIKKETLFEMGLL